MPGTTDTLAALVAPDTIDALFLRPLQAVAVSTNPAVSTVRVIGANALTVPRVSSDPDTAWLDELEPAPLVDLAADDIRAEPKRASSVVLLSRELVEDSSPSAQAEVGDALVRGFAKDLDAAFVSDGTGDAGKQPDGLAALPVGAGADQVQDLAIGANPADVFWMEDALALAEGTGASPTALLVNPLDAAMLGKLRAGTGSNVPLLGSDPANPRVRTISGVPLVKVPSLARGAMWLVDGTRVRTVIRRDARIDVSTHAYFREDGVAVKVSARATFAFPHARSLVRVRFAAPV